MTTPRPVRHRCELFGRFERAAFGPLKVRVLDLSEAGAFIEEIDGLSELQVGDHASLAIALPGGGVWQARAVISRIGTSRRDVKHPVVQHVTVVANGFGLEFDAMEDDSLEQLRGYLELLDER